MRRLFTWFSLFSLGSVSTIAAPQLQTVPQQPQSVFGGANRTVSLCWRNAGVTLNETTLQSRMMQLTSATAVCVGASPWKTLRVLPGQTVLDTATLEFPPVRARTRFLVQWVEGDSNVLGSTEVFAYPTNLLAELGVLLGHREDALAIYDPDHELKPLLERVNVGFVDLENTVAENFRGRLAIVGPFKAEPGARSLVTAQVNALAEQGVAVVWVHRQAESPELEAPQPSFYSLPTNPSSIVVVQPSTVANLDANPVSQLNLVFFCKLALHPKPLELPILKSQP